MINLKKKHIKLGFLDQNLALKWIYKNAYRFGGDKTKITISGHSAGAWSVGYHLFYKKSWPYFRNAILESGGPTGSSNPE
jgi:carboxylesterase type B